MKWWPFKRKRCVDAIRAELKDFPGVAVSTRDGSKRLRCLPKKEIEWFLAIWHDRHYPLPPYCPEKFDCDDRSSDVPLGQMKLLWNKLSHGDEALCFGRIWWKAKFSECTHECLWFLNSDKKFHIIEGAIGEPTMSVIEDVYEVYQ